MDVVAKTILRFSIAAAGCLVVASAAVAQSINITKDRIQFSDGTQQSTAATIASARTVTVSPTIGNASASGQTLRDAMDAIALANDATSAFPYYLVLEPGTFDLGAATLELPEFVHLRGAGMSATTLRGNPVSVTTDPVLRTNGNGVISDLTVIHKGGAGQFGRGIVAGGESMRFQNVRVLVTGSFGSNAILTALSTAGGCKIVVVDCIFEVEPTSAALSAIGVIVGNSPSTFTADGLKISVQASVTPAFSVGLSCNMSSDVEVSNADIFASPGTSRFAVFADTTSLLSIRNSIIETTAGGTALQASNTPVRVLGSQIIGARFGSNVIYRNCVDGNFSVIP